MKRVRILNPQLLQLHLLLLVTAILLIPSFLSKAQAQADTAAAETAEKTKIYLQFGGGIGSLYGRDEGMSPLIYSGPLFNFVGGLFLEQQYTLHDFYYHYSLGFFQPENESSAAVGGRGEMGYQYKRKISSEDATFNWYLGADASLFSGIRAHTGYQNSMMNYEVMLSLSPAAQVSRNFIFGKRDFRAGFNLKVPVVSLLLRPAYVTSIPPGFLDFSQLYGEALFESFSLTSFNDLVRVQTQLYLQYFLKNGSAIRGSYSWDFYHINNIPENTVNMGYHIFTTSLLFKL